MRTERAANLVHRPVSLDVLCIACNERRLKNVAAEYSWGKRCKGCEHPVGPWVDYCAYCTCEDEGDCW